MADSSALSFRTFSYPAPPYVSRSKSVPSSRKFSHFPQPQLSSRHIRITAKASSSDSGNFLGDDAFGFFPWAHGDSGIPNSLVLCLNFMILYADLISEVVCFHNFELPYNAAYPFDWSLCLPKVDIKFDCAENYLFMVSSGLDNID